VLHALSISSSLTDHCRDTTLNTQWPFFPPLSKFTVRSRFLFDLDGTLPTQLIPALN
jgi:hypothetical protein